MEDHHRDYSGGDDAGAGALLFGVPLHAYRHRGIIAGDSAERRGRVAQADVAAADRGGGYSQPARDRHARYDGRGCCSGNGDLFRVIAGLTMWESLYSHPMRPNAGRIGWGTHSCLLYTSDA